MTDKNKIDDSIPPLDDIYYPRPICCDCVHLVESDRPGRMRCRAFPAGVPDSVLYGVTHKHNKVIAGQIGRFTFKKRD